MKNRFWLYALIFCGFQFITQCKKEEQTSLPTIITKDTYSVTQTTANCSGKIISNGGLTIDSYGLCWSTQNTPTIQNHIIAFSSTADSFSFTITDLIPNNTYYIRAFAKNSLGVSYGQQIVIKTYTGTMTDIEGNVYNTVTIGNQIWMAENLKTRKYQNGDYITNIKEDKQWQNSIAGSYCSYNNDSIIPNYGLIYNWYAIIDSRKVCPSGWHIPSDEEWTTLENYLGGDSVAGSKMRETGTSHWAKLEPGISNESGFTSLPSGFRNYDGNFYGIGTYCGWWSSTIIDPDFSRYRCINLQGKSLNKPNNSKSAGFSIRCIKD